MSGGDGSEMLSRQTTTTDQELPIASDGFQMVA